MEFLVLPRMIALIIMIPLLCVYSDVLGILGGLIVGVGMLDLGLIEYFNRTKEALHLSTFGVGSLPAVTMAATDTDASDQIRADIPTDKTQKVG